MKENDNKQIVQRVFALSLSDVREDPCLAQRVLRIAREKEKRHMKYARALALALVLALVFATTAYALTRPRVLEWLLGDHPASRQLTATVQDVLSEKTEKGITVRIGSVVFDGKSLAFSYEVENAAPDMPVLVAAQRTVLVDGKEADLLHCTAFYSAPQMVPSPHLDVLPVKRNPAVGGGYISMTEAPEGWTECEVTFAIYAPKNKFAVVLSSDSMQANAESYTGDARLEALDSLNTLKSFQNVIFVEEADLTDAAWLAHEYTVIDGSGRLYGSLDNSCLQEIARIGMTFSFDAEAVFSCDFSRTDDVMLEECTVHVEAFRLSSLETYLNLWLIPRENTEQAARDVAEKYGAYMLTDERGQTVEYSEMDYMASFAPRVTQRDGRWMCQYQSTMPGLLRFPESVRITAGDTELIRFDLGTEE